MTKHLTLAQFYLPALRGCPVRRANWMRIDFHRAIRSRPGQAIRGRGEDIGEVAARGRSHEQRERGFSFCGRTLQRS